MVFAYIDAKHPEVLVPPTASEHMQSVMQRHTSQSELDWRKMDRQASTEITSELGC